MLNAEAVVKPKRKSNGERKPSLDENTKANGQKKIRHFRVNESSSQSISDNSKLQTRAMKPEGRLNFLFNPGNLFQTSESK